MEKFGEIIYTPEVEEEVAISKRETHTPKIEVPEKVKVGEPFQVRVYIEEHPNTVQHSFRWIEVYFRDDGRDFNPIFVARADLSPEISEQEVTFRMTLRKSGVIYALAYCNLHGVWENRMRVEVE